MGNDAVESVEWTVPEGLTQPKSPTEDNAKATVWLAGGEVGLSYPILCVVHTTFGRRGERTFYLGIEQR